MGEMSQPLEATRRLIAADLGSGPGAAHVAHELARPVLMVRLRGRKPQHGRIVRLHLHPVRMPASQRMRWTRGRL